MIKQDGIKLTKIEYRTLNSKAQETYNFHKMAAILADYGYNCLWLNDDWNGADCIAVHIDGISDFKIQLKGSISFARKYWAKNIYITFFEQGDIYIYPHDYILAKIEHNIADKTWMEKGTYFQTKKKKKFREILEPYKVPKVN